MSGFPALVSRFPAWKIWADAVNLFSATPRPLIMGILNVTPDSFSDGGRFDAQDLAIAQGERLVAEGADILDIGGESTRPTATPVAAEEEMARILPVISALAQRVSVPISVDTMKADVARAALNAGASIINDVWGFQRDLDMAKLAAEAQCPVVIMHNRREIVPDLDIIADVLAFLRRSLDLAQAAGVAKHNLIIDPGFGFGKTPAQNLDLIRHMDRLRVLGCPILLGVSRKSTIGHVTGRTIPDERLAGSLAAALIGAQNGADILRVHDVAAHRDAVAMLNALKNHT